MLFSVSVLVIGTIPTSLPKRFNIWFTLSRRKVCLPCSNSRTRRKPTPDFSESSTCVRLYCLRIAFTYFERVVCSIYAINYTLSGANIVQTERRAKLNRLFSLPRCRLYSRFTANIIKVFYLIPYRV